MRDRWEDKSKVVFVIVTWNRKEVLGQCLFSLKKHVQCPHHILVVDNASVDGTSEMLRKEYPEVILIENKKNLGFGRANNQGMNYLMEGGISFDYVVFFNDDAKLEDGSLKTLIDYMDKNHDVKASMPSVFIDKGQFQTGVGGYDLSLRTAFNYSFFLSILFPSLFKGFFIHQGYFRNRGLILELDWISGVCMILRSDVAGFLRFSEDFFMYAEDIALCREIRNHGKIVYFPLSQIYHYSESYRSDKISTLWIDSLFHYYRLSDKERIPAKLWQLKLIFVFGFLLRALGYTVFSVFSNGKNYKKKRKDLLHYSRHIINNDLK